VQCSSLTATTRYPRATAVRAAHDPTLPNPWTAIATLGRERPHSSTISSTMTMHPRPVADSRPSEPPSGTGLPVTTPGVHPSSWAYSSTIHAIVRASVYKSGAGMSR
jgi:hypothetical protein